MTRLWTIARGFLLLFAAAALPVAGEVASLVADLRVGDGPNRSSNPSGMVRIGRKVVFFAEGSAGYGLWTTDGTPAGTRKLADESYPTASVGLLGGSYLWFGETPEGELALWRTAGTPASTQLLVPDGIVEPDPDDFPIPWTIRDGKLYFFRRQDALELWTSDGTATGTRLAARLPQVDNSPLRFASVQGLLYFFTAGKAAGYHTPYEHWDVWRSDGTAGGTRRLATLPAYVLAAQTTSRRLLFLSGGRLWASDGSTGGTSALFGPPRDPALEVHVFLGSVGDKLFFLARTSGSTESLWVSDGTRRGTRVLSPALSPLSSTAAIVGDRIFFVAGDGVHGNELWSSRGTPETTLATDLCPGPCSAFTDPYSASLVAVGGRIFFLADSLPGQGLFVSDGTTTGTRRLLDLCSSPCRFSNLRPEGGEVYFYGHDPARGATLWASDGTATGTRLLIDFGHAEPFGSSYLPPSPSLAVLGSRVVTVGFEPQSGLEPWALDRHGGGGQLLADIARGGEPGSFPEDAVALGDRLLFKAWDGEKKAAIWATLGSAATTVKLADFPSSLLSLYDPPPSIALVGDRAFLNLGDLWVTDGTPGGTVRLTELGAATGGLRVTSAIVNCSGQAVFAVSDPQHTQLWSSDGTPEGTLAHGLILPFAVFELTAVGEDLYFWGNDGGPSRWEIWKTDCALTKLRRLTNLDDFLGTPPPGFARSGAFAYFLLPEPSGGSALWRSDGTRKGTVKVPSPEMDGVAQRPKAYVPREDGTLLLFTEGDRLRFWTTDGTAAGTALVRELDPGSTLQEVVPGGAGSVEFLVWNFYANPSGFRLYRTDGTPQGTHGLIDFAALGLAYVANVTRAGGHLFFAAGSAWDDTELWESDGTQETTRRFQEIAPGSQSSSPRPLAVAGSRLYLSAGDGLHGRELWSLPLDDLGGPCRPSASALCLGQGRFRAELFFHDRGNRRGDAYAVPWSSSSGAFWFYDYGNPEAVVKLADGPSGLFFGPLTDAYLSLTVTDVTTGEVRRYPGETGPLPAFADLSPPPAALGSAGDEKLTSAAQAVPSSCVPTPTRLCLYEGRFELELTGVEKPAHVFAHGERAGYFTFGGGNDVEAAFKLLDGRGQNGRFWLFAAMLTDLPAMLTVTDTTDGTVHVFTKPPGPPASFIDLSSLP